MQQNFGLREASRLVNNIHPQPPSLDHRNSINDPSKDGDVFHPTNSGPSNGGIGHKPSTQSPIPRVFLQSPQPPSLDHEYSINDENKDGDDFFRPTKSGPSDGGIGHKPSPWRAIPRVLLRTPQPPSLDHKYSINDENKDGDDFFRPTKSGPSDGGRGHKPSPWRAIPRVLLQSPSLDYRYSINDDDSKDGDKVFGPTDSGPSNGNRHKTSQLSFVYMN